MGLGAVGTLAAQSSPTDDQKKSLEQSLKGRSVTAKIDLPILRGMRVFLDGNIDLDDYRGKLRLPPSLLEGDRAVLTRVNVKRDKIEVLLNQGGQPGVIHEGHLRWFMGKRPDGSRDLRTAGSRLDIIFDRRITGADARPEVIVTALANVIAIDGLAPVTTTPAAPASAASQASPVQSEPVLELMGVEVQPTKLTPGQTLQLVMRLEVSGLPAGEKLAVAEERQLYLDEKPLFSEPRARFTAWGNGIHTTALTFDLPAAAPPGVYTFVGTLRSDLGVVTKDALFVVER